MDSMDNLDNQDPETQNIENEEESGTEQPYTSSLRLEPQKKTLRLHLNRRRRGSCEKLLKLCTSTLKANSQPVGEFDAIGINVARKLAKMEPLQALYAEYLINGILRKGTLGKLEETDVCDGGCNFRRTATPCSTATSLSSSTPPQTLQTNTIQLQDQTTELRSFYESQIYLDDY